MQKKKRKKNSTIRNIIKDGQLARVLECRKKKKKKRKKRKKKKEKKKKKKIKKKTKKKKKKNNKKKKKNNPYHLQVSASILSIFTKINTTEH